MGQTECHTDPYEAFNVQLNSLTKMRNHLAGKVLNKDMPQILEYRTSEGVNGFQLDDIIELLKQTSDIVSFFRDPRPIRDMGEK